MQNCSCMWGSLVSQKELHALRSKGENKGVWVTQVKHVLHDFKVIRFNFTKTRTWW